MRPRGQIRTVLARTLPELVAQRGPVTSRDVAAVLYVEPCIARWALRNMVCAGEVVVVGAEKPAGSDRWHSLYEPAEPGAHGPWVGLDRLTDAMRQFVRVNSSASSPEPA
jgi:hypothetical protein